MSYEHKTFGCKNKTRAFPYLRTICPSCTGSPSLINTITSSDGSTLRKMCRAMSSPGQYTMIFDDELRTVHGAFIYTRHRRMISATNIFTQGFFNKMIYGFFGKVKHGAKLEKKALI